MLGADCLLTMRYDVRATEAEKLYAENTQWRGIAKTSGAIEKDTSNVCVVSCAITKKYVYFGEQLIAVCQRIQ